MPEVASTNWKLLESLAERWHSRISDSAVLAQSSPEQRATDPCLRAAFAVERRDRILEAGNFLGDSCLRCGEVTCCWCESCEYQGRPTVQAICSPCDQAHEICSVCQSQGFEYPEDSAQPTGFYVTIDGEETFVEQDMADCKQQ